MENRQSFGMFVLVLMLCFIGGRAYAGDGNSYPHNAVSGISCPSCHSILELTTMVDFGYSGASGLDDSFSNNLCWGCHNEVDAPMVQTHSHVQIGDDYGEWSVNCVTCHDPHQQYQVIQNSPDVFLATGVSTGIQRDTRVTLPWAPESTLTDTTRQSWVVNEFQKLDDEGLPSNSQTYTLIPDTSYDPEYWILNRDYGYEILSNTENSITVEGIFDDAIAPGDTYVIVYGKLVKGIINTDDILVNVGTTKGVGNKTVKFFNNTGPNSFADINEDDYDGICEVCHTETYFHKNTSAGDHSHNNEKNCTTECHKHTKGFKGEGCDVCHGFPPISDLLNADSPPSSGNPEDPGNTGLVDDPDGITTGSDYAGAHFKHVDEGEKDYDCTFCHFGQDVSHNDGGSRDITIAFSLFSGPQKHLGGSYDGQTTANYDVSDGNPTTVSNDGTMTCSSIYCHSNADPFDGTNQYNNQTWNGSSLTCSSCHNDGSTASFLSGKHDKHIASRYDFPCEKCHDETVELDAGTRIIKEESYHVNNEKDVFFSAGGTYDVPTDTKACTSTYCHSQANQNLPAASNPPNDPVEWDSTFSMECYSCHKGRNTDDTVANCASIGGTWDGALLSCTFPDQASCEDSGGEWDADKGCYTVLGMMSNGHSILTSKKADREYPCYTCHDATMDEFNDLDGFASHVNEVKDIVFRSKWYLYSGATPTYDPDEKVCDNFYCHSDGTYNNPKIEPYPWTDSPRGCNACHGHQGDCADCHTDITGWAAGEEWKSAMPMYTNQGPGMPKANSHLRHVQTKFTCNQCHAKTVLGGACSECHTDTFPPGTMAEAGHVNTMYHLNKEKDVLEPWIYDKSANKKTCTGTGTSCHTGVVPPTWGDEVTGLVICLECHGDTSDVDNFLPFDGVRGKINMNEFRTTGHGRLTADGPYPESLNPAANFPGNPCWYCHDNQVLHNDYTNPYRLKQHDQFEKRFEKECMYCHMEGFDSECLDCHNTSESTLAPQLDDITTPTYSIGHENWNIGGVINGYATCLDVSCHGGSPPDPHNADAGLWKDYEINSVRNQYMMMGVCLKCHDDDSNSKCTECHTAKPEAVQNGGTRYKAITRHFSTADDEPGVGANWASYWISDETATTEDAWEESEAYTDNKFELGYEPGTGFVVAAQARASSVHFGYKHYAAYEEDFDAESQDQDYPDGIVFEDADPKTNELKKTPGVEWAVTQVGDYSMGEWAGDYVMMTSGNNIGEYRRILNNTADTLTMEEDFTYPVEAGDTYYINDPVWKGGKFCWDCHDPHGDTNIFMIQDEVATETDGTFGAPVTKRTVVFTQKTTGTDYVKTTGATPDDFDGICNVCHTEDGMHFRYNYGNTSHNQDRVCTDCHEHRFTDSHASGLSCATTDCHGAKPVPRHSGFGLPKDCTKCHSGIINKRVDIITQLSETNSHHIQGVEVTNKHCYACHWEATDIGLINEDYHEGYSFSDHISEKNAAADLVIWGEGFRPTTYVTDVTATTFTAKYIGNYLAIDADNKSNERQEVENVTLMCLGCHSEQNNDYEPFNIVDDLNGDCKTPNQYAWDGTSIAERYLQTETTTWGKYDTVSGAAPKAIQKAFSAHGNAVNNEGGWDPTDGLDGAIASTRSGDNNRNVQCFDCHSSHGSRTMGITSSYATFNGTFNGGNLKETQGGKGGYVKTYRAQANSDAGVINPYNEGAAQCFDCHHTETAKTELFEQPDNWSPWGYTQTFGVDAGIGVLGYKDTPYFAQGITASIDRFDYRLPKAIRVGGHLHASKPIKDSGTSEDIGSDTSTLLYSTKSAVWTTDKWVGYFVLMKSGDNDGEMRKIISNTTTELTVYAFDNDIGTDDYEIVQPMIKERGTASGGDTITVVDDSKVGPKAWTTDKWVGNFVLMKSGNNAGKLRRISENTETELTVDEFANVVADGDSYEIVPYSKTINGLCTPCHDPHGVSPTLGDNQRYGVPLLKGTWMTSPYKEDRPPIDPIGSCANDKDGNGFMTSWGKYARCAVNGPTLDAATNYYIDRNTFEPDSNPKNFDRITEDDHEFAGLCLKCHPKENLTDEEPRNTNFRTKDRVHESVKGWGVNSEHSWPCAKCHQPHISGLPRLMQTNCLDYEHRGLRESGGLHWSSKKETGVAASHQQYRGYPEANTNGVYNDWKNDPSAISADYKAEESCHSRASYNFKDDGVTQETYPDTNRWNNLTQW